MTDTHDDKERASVKPLSTLDEALAAIPTNEELREVMFNRAPPRWAKYALEWRFKVSSLAEAGLSSARSAVVASHELLANLQWAKECAEAEEWNRDLRIDDNGSRGYKGIVGAIEALSAQSASERTEIPAELFDGMAVWTEMGVYHTCNTDQVSFVLDAVVRLIRKNRATDATTDSRANPK